MSARDPSVEPQLPARDSRSRCGVEGAFGWRLRLSVRLDGFVGRLIFVADGSRHRSQVPGAQPLEAIRWRSTHLISDCRGHPELPSKFDHRSGRLARLVALAAIIVGCLVDADERIWMRRSWLPGGKQQK